MSTPQFAHNTRHPRRAIRVLDIGLLLFASVALLTLAAEPFGQWYLAWVGLVPWLIAIGQSANVRAAVLGGWLAGVLYFAVNLWWLWTASIPGTIVLVLYFGLYWALAAALVRGLQLCANNGDADRHHESWRTAYQSFAVAAVWVAAEWLRSNVASGFPWLPLGSTQSPIPLMCQVADIGGPWIVSFWVALVNGAVATIWLHRREPQSWRAPTIGVIATLAAVAGYGAWRLYSTTTSSGPRVAVLQSNFRHVPGGAPTVSREEAVEFFITELQNRLAGQPADLVVLPEAALPPINDEARRELARSQMGPFLDDTYRRLTQIAKDQHTTLLAGGNAVTGWTTRGSEHIGTEIRNSAYVIDPQAEPPLMRYDKIYLARFSERAALTIGPAWLRRLAAFISAPRAAQPMFAGRLDDLRPFRLNWTGSVEGTPFIAPICLENIDSATFARMVCGPSPAGKQAEFIINISNDGWFGTQEKYQHLQTTIFRCIENRVPMVRSSNTGISAFIDSSGRVEETIAPNTSGFAVRTIALDGRRTFYMRYGDVFPIGCVIVVAIDVLARLARRHRAHSRPK
jgi:apolipoprotein N-acyltransferase